MRLIHVSFSYADNPSVLQPQILQGARPDRQKAKLWKERIHARTVDRPSVHLHNSTITGMVGSVNQGTFSAGLSKTPKPRFEDAASNPFFEEDSDSESESEEVSTEKTVEEGQGLKYPRQPVDSNIPGISEKQHINNDDDPNIGEMSNSENEAEVQRSERTKSTGETDIYDEPGSGNDSEPDYESFTRAYNSMENDKKWVLTTGTIVEDALYDFGVKCMHEHLCHSFVVDPDDENYLNEGVFTQHELEEIRDFQKKVLPPVPRDLLLYLDSFRMGTTADLRRLVFRQEAMDQNFDRHKDFDRDWIRNTVYNLLREYEADSLTKKHLELWLLIHVGSFIDKAFEDISGIVAVRGESCCLASSARKNGKRTVAALIMLKRKMLGRRSDLIIRKISMEYGCAEAGRLFEGEKGTKLLREKGLKTPKMLKDIFNNLCAAVDGDEQKVRKLESIGFLHAGLVMSLLRLDSPAGYTCRVSCSKSLEIPSQVAEFSSKALPVILLAWRAKATKLSSSLTTPAMSVE
ncbi:hypothetical protein BC936DRAFT_137490, partial [Jimgerdemannia flammicorona]